MERMTRARLELEALEEARSQVGRRRRSVKTLRERCGPMVSNWGAKGSGHRDGSSPLWDSLADQTALLEKEEQQLRAMEERLEQWIDLLPRPRWRMVLRCHYLDSIPLAEIADELKNQTGREFSMGQVYRFHRQALNAADQLWPLS